MAKARLRFDLIGHKVPAYSVEDEEDTQIDLSGRSLEVYHCEVLGDVFDEYNAIVIVAGKCYFINTIEVDFI